MSALAKLKVTERHGIRRFLYPLHANVSLPGDISVDRLSLRLPNGSTVPAYVGDDPDSPTLSRIDFAVSMAPFETVELELVEGEHTPVPDPMSHHRSGGGGIETTQERFATTIDDNGLLSRVLYDGLDHLNGPLSIRVNGQRYSENNTNLLYSRASEIAASVLTGGTYASGIAAATLASSTACKSWVSIQHRTQVRPSDRVSFELPFAVASPILVCDFGAGGGIYTKLDRSAGTVVRCDHGFPQWSLRNGDRTDYAGKTDQRDLESQAWFHVVDSSKAIAVAVTSTPACVESLASSVDPDGTITVEWTVHDQSEDAVFAVCYHFLNDVPAIAAATCPQSILLTPSVEVVD